MSNSIKDLWNKNKKEEKENSFSNDSVPVETGVYIMQLVSRDIKVYGDKNPNEQIMLGWTVIGDDKYKGKICKQFMPFEEEFMVWILRLLLSLQVDVDKYNIESYEDIGKIFDELINQHTCATIKVIEKKERKYLQNHKLAEVDEKELFPIERPTYSTSIAEEEEDVEEINIGTRVKWKDVSGNTLVGEIKEFSDNQEEAKVLFNGRKRGKNVPIEDLIVLNGEKNEDNRDNRDNRDNNNVSDNSTDNNKSDNDIAVGTKVSIDFDGEIWTAVITSIPPSGNDVQVTFDEDGTIEMIPREELIFSAKEEPVDELRVGEGVTVKIRGKDVEATIEKINDDNTAIVILPNGRDVTVKISNITKDDIVM